MLSTPFSTKTLHMFHKNIRPPLRSFFRRNKKKDNVNPKTPRFKFYRGVLIIFCGTGGLMLWSRLANNKIEIIADPKKPGLLDTLEKNPVFMKPYHQTFWMPMGWMQVFYGALYESPYPVEYKREIYTLRDGENVSIDWAPVKDAYERNLFHNY